MLTKLRISNEKELLKELEGSSEDFFIEAYGYLCRCLDVKNTIPLTIHTSIIDLCELSFDGLDKKTNTYYYNFIEKDF